MIDVRELRIGNCLLLRGKVVLVGGIPNCMCLLIPGEQYAVDIEVFDSIPLTEDLLLKCGFEWSVHYEAYTHECLRVEIFKNTGSRYCRIEYEDKRGEYDNKLYLSSEAEYVVSEKSIEYLHQLQNLYFALTNKELEITL